MRRRKYKELSLIEVHNLLVRLLKPIEKLKPINLDDFQSKKCFNIGRVSSEEQKKEGKSADIQLIRLNRYCSEKNWEIYKSLKDEGYPANHPDRPAYLEMLNDEGKFNVYQVTELSRFVRNVAYFLIMKGWMNKKGIIINSLDDNNDYEFLQMIIMGLNQEEKRRLIKRTEETQLGLIESEKKLLNRPPFGYSIKKIFKEGKLVKTKFVQDSNAVIVKSIFYLYSKKKKRSDIANIYNMSVQTVTNILKNETYIGILRYKGKKYKGKFNPIFESDDEIKLFYKCKKIISKNGE